MLPVAHQACTLATGALRSSWTMIVSPFGRIHFCAVLSGKLITDEGSVGAAFKLTMLNNRPAQKNFATGIRFIRINLAASIAVISDLWSAISGQHSLARRRDLRAAKCAGGFAVAGFSGAKGFTKTSSKS